MNELIPSAIITSDLTNGYIDICICLDISLLHRLVDTILNVCNKFGILELCLSMIEHGCHMSKFQWKEYVWSTVRRMEDEEYALMFKVIKRSYFLVWWISADVFPATTNTCEIMDKLVCNASLLKDNDYRLKKLSFSHKVCTACDLSVRENVNHIVMQCPGFSVRSEMCDILKSIEDCYIQEVLKEPHFLML